MRVREARQASLPAPPEELLWFGNRTCSGPGPGMGAYPDRAAWLAARRDWETRHGMTVAEWSAATLAELQRRAGSMAELNEALELTMYERRRLAGPAAERLTCERPASRCQRGALGRVIWAGGAGSARRGGRARRRRGRG